MSQVTDPPPLANPQPLPAPTAAQPGENAVVWMLWLTYGAFYFCRTNISAAVKGMGMPLDEGGLDLTGTEIGWILASLKIAYGLGQLLNGQLSERIPPRVMLAPAPIAGISPIAMPRFCGSRRGSVLAPCSHSRTMERSNVTVSPGTMAVARRT